MSVGCEVNWRQIANYLMLLSEKKNMNFRHEMYIYLYFYMEIFPNFIDFLETNYFLLLYKHSQIGTEIS